MLPSKFIKRFELKLIQCFAVFKQFELKSLEITCKCKRSKLGIR